MSSSKPVLPLAGHREEILVLSFVASAAVWSAAACYLPAHFKEEEHRIAISAAATSDNPRFFLGTDSAPRHPKGGCQCPVALSIAGIANEIRPAKFQGNVRNLINYEQGGQVSACIIITIVVANSYMVQTRAIERLSLTF